MNKIYEYHYTTDGNINKIYSDSLILDSISIESYEYETIKGYFKRKITCNEIIHNFTKNIKLSALSKDMQYNVNKCI